MKANRGRYINILLVLFLLIIVAFACWSGIVSANAAEQECVKIAHIPDIHSDSVSYENKEGREICKLTLHLKRQFPEDPQEHIVFVESGEKQGYKASFSGNSVEAHRTTNPKIISNADVFGFVSPPTVIPPTSTFTQTSIPPTSTFTPTSTPDIIPPTFTSTFTPTFTPTFTLTFTPTNTPTGTLTPTDTPTNTPTNTITLTITETLPPTDTTTPQFPPDTPSPTPPSTMTLATPETVLPQTGGYGELFGAMWPAIPIFVVLVVVVLWRRK